MRQGQGQQKNQRQKETVSQSGFLQGDLQVVFDALYELGVIEPVLEMDWRKSLIEIENGSPELERAVRIVNRCGRDITTMKSELSELTRKALELLAMEVAREYAGFHTREDDENGLQ